MVARCLAAPGFLAHLLVSKYADHLPFSRLQTLFWQRQHVFIARPQMVLRVSQCVVLLEALVVCLKQEPRQSPFAQVNETPVRYLDLETPGKCAQGYLWAGLVAGKCVDYETKTAVKTRFPLETLAGPGNPTAPQFTLGGDKCRSHKVLQPK